jgi:hypothetical protein
MRPLSLRDVTTGAPPPRARNVRFAPMAVSDDLRQPVGVPHCHA